METLRLAFALFLLAACLPEPKEDLDDPPVVSTRSAQLIDQLEDGVVATNLRVAGDRLYVSDESGLLIYDIETPAAPRLIGRVDDGRVDHTAIDGTRVYLIETSGDRLREWDVSDPSAPVQLANKRSITRTFGGIDAANGLVWHAVGSSPPSRLFYQQAPITLESSCFADDRERGIMDVWLHPGLAIVSVHFDDFAGDGLDGNGGFGFALMTLEQRPGECPTTHVTDIVLADSHGLNRSTFEQPTNSDLQAAYVPATRTLFLTGEQRVRRFIITTEGRASLRSELIIPEVLDVEVDSSAAQTLLGMANGDFALATVSESGELEFGGRTITPGVARAVAAAADGVHFYVADSERGVAVLEVGVTP